MEYEGMLKSLHLESAAELLAPHWEESEASFPTNLPSFLRAPDCLAYREFASVPPEVDRPLQATAAAVQANPALLHLAWHCQRLLYRYRDYPGPHIARWPDMTASLGELGGLFYLLVALSVVPEMLSRHTPRGLPEQISRDTVSHFARVAGLHWDQTAKRWQTNLRILYWSRYHAWGELVRLGRFEYMVRPFAGRVQAFRETATGRVVALAEDGVRFTQQGYIDADPASPAMTAGFTASLQEDDSGVTGTLITPLGRATQTIVHLPRDRWQRVLAAGDPLLDTHIPTGGGMTPERCQASMAQALEFFPRYFPERAFRGFGCASWILNPEIADFYRPDSNMVLWQREAYLFPWPSSGKAGISEVFGPGEVDLATAPRDTSLRRAMLDHLAAGGYLRAGGMFLLTEDFPHYGAQFYRSQRSDDLPNPPAPFPARS